MQNNDVEEGAKMNTASQVNGKESRINVKLLWRQETMIRPDGEDR